MAYLEITLKVSNDNRPAAAKVYNDYKGPFLKEIKGAQSKNLLVRDDDVQVLHGFATVADAQAYLETEMFNQDVVKGLAPYLDAEPEIRIYDVA
jgi:Holliday junction resolvase